jgi:uncharacterized protein
MLAILYLAVVGYMYATQRDQLFKPSGVLSDPDAAGLVGVRTEEIAMADGTVVTVWRADAARRNLPTVLYFHGQGGNISTRSKRFRQILDSGLGLYAPSYRGYAGSQGAPSQDLLIQDALRHFDRADAISAGIVIHGESLGTAIATAVAAERDADALVLEAPFTAAVDLASDAYPWLPVSVLMKDQFRSRDWIGAVSEPLMIAHGTTDKVVPYENGRALYELANDPKRFVRFDGAGHTDLWQSGLWDRELDFLRAEHVLPEAQ